MQCALVHAMGLLAQQNVPELLTVGDGLRVATMGGAKALGMSHRLGSLSIGKAADIMLPDAEALNLAPLNNVPGAVVTPRERNNLDTVLVGGQIRKWGGSLLNADLPKLRNVIIASRDGIFARAGVEQKIVRLTAASNAVALKPRQAGKRSRPGAVLFKLIRYRVDGPDALVRKRPAARIQHRSRARLDRAPGQY